MYHCSSTMRCYLQSWVDQKLRPNFLKTASLWAARVEDLPEPRPDSDWPRPNLPPHCPAARPLWSRGFHSTAPGLHPQETPCSCLQGTPSGPP